MATPSSELVVLPSESREPLANLIRNRYRISSYEGGLSAVTRPRPH